MRPRNLIRKRVKSLTTKTVSRTRERHSSHSNSNSRAKYKRGLYGTKSIGEEDYKDLDDCFQYAKAPTTFITQGLITSRTTTTTIPTNLFYYSL